MKLWPIRSRRRIRKLLRLRIQAAQNQRVWMGGTTGIGASVEPVRASTACSQLIIRTWCADWRGAAPTVSGMNLASRQVYKSPQKEIEPMSIICATDFSPAGEAAVGVAASLARRLGQPLVLVHSVQIPYASITYAAAVPVDWARPVYEAAAGQLETAAESLRSAGLAVMTELRFGPPVASILELARSRDAEAVVLGTHGRGGLARFFLGSVAEQVVRDAPVPVFVVPARSGADGRQAEERWRMALLLDGAPTDPAALAWAAKMAERTATDVTIVRLVSPELEAARFGIDELWDGTETSGPLIEALKRSLDRELVAFPTLAQAPRRFLVGNEQTVIQTGNELAALDPTFVVLAVAARQHQHARRAVRPTSLLRALRVPAACIPESAVALPSRIPSIESVLVAVDLDDPAPEALLSAYGMVRHTGGRVELCYVRARDWDLAEPVTVDQRRDYEDRLRALVPREAELLGIATNVSVLEGETASGAIRQAAARLGADVIALATHDRRGLDRALRGSVSDAVVHETATPTLVVHT
jgi:nucleotide-binding universal stress UspA family protein